MSLIAIFIASLLGSLHCVGMCGGFVALCTGTSSAVQIGVSPFRTHGAYNFGRFTSYVFLGGVAGILGQFGNKVTAGAGIAHGATIILGSLVIIWGLSSLALNTSAINQKLQPITERFSTVYKNLLAILPREPSQRAFSIGLLSAFLPCGWLYAYVALAATSGSPIQGMILMGVFWLGTLPALLGVGWIASKLSETMKRKLPIITSLLLIAAGLFAINEHLGLLNIGHCSCHH